MPTCNYPQCNCPFDMGPDNKCLRGYSRTSNFIFASGNKDALNISTKDRRFTTFKAGERMKKGNKQFDEFNVWQQILLRLAWAIEKKIYNRKWSFFDLVWRARVEITSDEQWLSHNEIARKICERHKFMVSDNWCTTPRESIDGFRDRLNLNPHSKKSTSTNADEQTLVWKTGKPAEGKLFLLETWQGDYVVSPYNTSSEKFYVHETDEHISYTDPNRWAMIK